jgi:hypothetical protein
MYNIISMHYSKKMLKRKRLFSSCNIFNSLSILFHLLLCVLCILYIDCYTLLRYKNSFSGAYARICLEGAITQVIEVNIKI